MARSETQHIHVRFEAHQRRQYVTIPFEMPENVERFELEYHYTKSKTCVIDLGLVGPQGLPVGGSGSDKKAFFISEHDATPGYRPTALKAGQWQILAGVYKISPDGMDVDYTLRFIFKEPRWLVGDTHTHTTVSDGILTPQSLAEHAHNQGFDYLVITDHNNFLFPEDRPKVPGLTIIPGMELTLYDGHSNFLGLRQPIDLPFFTNDFEGVLHRFQLARENGATIVINHPKDESLPFTFDFSRLPYDLIEIWNGPMRPSNLMAIALWQKLLEAGQKVPAIGGSDYHSDRLGLNLGVPSTVVHSPSASAADILGALRAGKSYIVFQRESPRLEMVYGDADLGESVPWQAGMPLSIHMNGVKAGSTVKLISQHDVYEFPQITTDGDFEGFFTPQEPGFLRLELWQGLFGVLPPMPVLVSNPIWMD